MHIIEATVQPARTHLQLTNRLYEGGFCQLNLKKKLFLPAGGGYAGEGCASGKCDGDAIVGVTGVEVPEDLFGEAWIAVAHLGTRTVQLLRRVRQRLVEYR